MQCRLAYFATFLIGAALSACGGGSGDGVPGVDPDQTLGELPTDQLEQVCRATVFDDYGLDHDRSVRWICYVQAISLHQSAPLLFGCVDTVTSCIAAGGPTASDPSDNPDNCMYTTRPALGSCAGVTVGQINGCLAALAQRAAQMVDSVSCDTSPDLVIGLPAACASVNQACPDLFDA